MRSGSDPELLLSPGHRRVVNGLHVMAVLLKEDVGEVGAEDGVTNVDRDDVRRGLLNSDSSSKQGASKVLHIELVSLSQLSKFKMQITPTISTANTDLPSSLLRTLMEARDPARTVGGREVVKMKPEV